MEKKREKNREIFAAISFLNICLSSDSAKNLWRASEGEEERGRRSKRILGVCATLLFPIFTKRGRASLKLKFLVEFFKRTPGKCIVHVSKYNFSCDSVKSCYPENGRNKRRGNISTVVSGVGANEDITRSCATTHRNVNTRCTARTANNARINV